MKESLEDVIREHSQIDPSFKTERCYVRVTASYIMAGLKAQTKYDLGSFCKKTINNMLNRLGYTLKKVLKTKPLKKTASTDAIFANVQQQHALAKANPRILRISIDTKAKVKVGNLSRGGYSRLLNAPIADDHDHASIARLVPFGLCEMDSNEVFITFGNSAETSDFIVDALEKWWNDRPSTEGKYDSLMIDLDNGKAVASNTKRFLERIVGFSQKINMPIQLVYYPPYHSKYNPIERVWAALENYWKPLILDTVDNTIKIAKQITWKGNKPTVSFMDKVYLVGVTLSKEQLELINPYIQRNKELPQWNVMILNKLTG